jgi:hypothetical protein
MFDYDCVISKTGAEVYHLRQDGAPLPVGFCAVTKVHGGWERLTQWHSRHGRRWAHFTDLDAALASGIAWARRRGR